MWRVSLAASLQFSDFFSCASLAAVSLWLHSCWLFFLPGLSSHVDPAGGKNSRQIQGKTLVNVYNCHFVVIQSLSLI